MSKAFTLSIKDGGIGELLFDLPGEKVNKLSTTVIDELSEMPDVIARDRAIEHNDRCATVHHEATSGRVGDRYVGERELAGVGSRQRIRMG